MNQGSIADFLRLAGMHPFHTQLQLRSTIYSDVKMHLCLNDHIRSELTDWWYSSHFQLQRNLTENIQCNLDLVTLTLVIILQRPFFNLLYKIIQFSDIM